MRDIGSLGPAFTSRILAGQIRVKPAFALALYGGFLTRLSRPLGAPEKISGAWRPTQTTHLPLSTSGLEMQLREGSVSLAPPRPLARPLRRLLPTLHTRSRTPATGCSKAPQGLRLRLGGTGLCASKSISPGSTRGQRGSRWTIHASRQLSGKVLRYLKRVRVTPAVYGPFFPLNGAFRYPHWAGFSGNTHPFGLAAAYVFIKQSEPPSHCDLLLLRAGTPSPKVTGLVCRVPSGGLHRHALGYSPRGTCVSSRYGRHRPRPYTFHGHPDSAEPSSIGGPITPSSPSHHYGTPGTSALRQRDGAARPIRMRHVWEYSLRRRRNINLLPFRCTPVRVHLRTG